jgi:hypothetical protein
MKMQPRAAALFLSAVLCLLASGCASVPSIDADRSATSRTKRIALLAIPEPREVPVANIGGAAGAFGLVGGLVQADVNLSQARQFAGFLKERKVDLSREFESAIASALGDAGFEVSIVRDQRAKPSPDGKTDDYSGVHVDADAILSVWSASFGYVSPPNTVHYQPSGVIRVRLLDAKSKADLYYKTFVLGWKLPIKQSVYLETGEGYRYRSIDAFVAAEGEAVQGLLGAQRIVAKRVGADLGSGPAASGPTGTGTAPR